MEYIGPPCRPMQPTSSSRAESHRITASCLLETTGSEKSATEGTTELALTDVGGLLVGDSDVLGIGGHVDGGVNISVGELLELGSGGHKGAEGEDGENSAHSFDSPC